MQQVVKIAILSALIVFSFACKKEDPTPVPPQIKFMDARFSDDQTYTIVRFEFYDEDGDLGLKQEENTGEQEFNLFIDYYEKQNGNWKLITPLIIYNNTTSNFDTTELHLRVPFIKNESQVALEGETEVKLLYDFNADTFRYEMYLKDRALQSSNIITTSELIVN